MTQIETDINISDDGDRLNGILHDMAFEIVNKLVSNPDDSWMSGLRGGDIDFDIYCEHYVAISKIWTNLCELSDKIKTKPRRI